MIYDFSIYIIDHAPWTIDIFPAKHIAIIPFLCFHIIGIQLIVVHHLLHFGIRQPKTFVKLNIRNRPHIKIIEPRKNTFF